MTLELQETLEREMNDALALEEPSRRQDAVLTVLAHQNRALVDCQRKTSDRVKELLKEREAAANKREGLKLGAMLLKAAINIGGPTGAIVLCKLTGILW